MKEFIPGNKALKIIIRETAEIAGYLWQRGWAEGNAGNISVNITDQLPGEISENDSFPFFVLQEKYPKLAGGSFFITGTGKRMRDLAAKPMNNALIIKLNEDASGYLIALRKAENEIFLPTSELATHLGIHQMIAERGSPEKVVMHTHATELVALTHEREFRSQDIINKLLWSMHSETAMFIPKGVGIVPYRLPGSVEIAKETLRALRNHDVALWEKHGVFAIGKSVSGTFDLIDILAKSARIFFLCRSAGIVPDSFTDEQIDELKNWVQIFSFSV